MTRKILIITFIAISIAAAYTKAPPTELQITMLDIGQGDALYIRTPQGKDIVIDGGPDRRILHELGEVMPPTDHTIEIVIATHPDADHIAGLTELPYYYDINTLITSGSKKHTGFSRAMESWEEQYGITVIHAYRGWTLELEENLILEFLHPNPPKFHEDPNDDSVTFLLRYKEFTALFTGDAPTEIEEEWVEYYNALGTQIDLDILKVGHHGSRTSTNNILLRAMTPKTALISVGLDNKFNHPHPGPIAKLQKIGAQIFRTDLHGRVACRTDGFSYACAPL